MAKVKQGRWFFTSPTVLAVLAGVLAIGVLSFQTQKNEPLAEEADAASNRAVCDDKYNPDVTASSFSTDITNQYTSLPVGRKLIYEGDTEDGRERIVISIPGDKKRIKIGNQTITTLVYRDTVWIDNNDDGKFTNNELHEDVRDYIAQRKGTKDIWYFGEDVNYYENGKVINHEGTWLAGREGAKPGIFVKHNPKLGESFLQECWEGEAEDTVDVVSVTQDLSLPIGKFKNCVRTYDYNPNDPESKENKFYCTKTIDGKAVNAKVLQKDKINGDRIELVKIVNSRERGNDDDKTLGI